MNKLNNKRLCNVTEEDAKEIIKAGYPLFFRTGRWKLYDVSNDMKEPCKKLRCELKQFQFFFYIDYIDISNSDPEKWDLDDSVFDLKLNCYLKAVDLGYFVPRLSERINTLSHNK